MVNSKWFYEYFYSPAGARHRKSQSPHPPAPLPAGRQVLLGGEGEQEVTENPLLSVSGEGRVR